MPHGNQSIIRFLGQLQHRGFACASRVVAVRETTTVLVAYLS
jgi:hypothetical protein